MPTTEQSPNKSDPVMPKKESKPERPPSPVPEAERSESEGRYVLFAEGHGFFLGAEGEGANFSFDNPDAENCPTFSGADEIRNLSVNIPFAHKLVPTFSKDPTFPKSKAASLSLPWSRPA